jgi:hypothetical protein
VPQQIGPQVHDDGIDGVDTQHRQSPGGGCRADDNMARFGEGTGDLGLVRQLVVYQQDGARSFLILLQPRMAIPHGRHSCIGDDELGWIG